MSQLRGNMGAMAFGQPAGPPANARLVEELRALLSAAGHTDFRDARGPMGFNQRQANGKFTRDEAEAFIAQLQAAADSQSAPVDAEAPRLAIPMAQHRVQQKPAKPVADLKRVPSEALAGELQLRGWIVVAP